MSRNILVVGRSFSRLANYISSHGDNYFLLADDFTAKKTGPNIYRFGFSSDDKILDFVDSIQSKTKFDAVLTLYENYVPITAKIAKHLRLPGIPIASANACTDKHLMRQLFAEVKESISPQFGEVTDLSKLQNFAQKHTFPLILKPANLAKSLLVTKNHTMDELMENYRLAIKNLPAIYKKYAPNKQPKLIIEEFLEGSIHSVDAFVDATGEPHVLKQVVDYQTGYDVGYDDNFHYSRLLPSRLSENDIEKIRHVASLGCRSLGMKNSPAHIEIILTKQGPKIVEIAARNGGYRERMHGLANGIDITGNAIKLAFGEEAAITSTRNDACAVLELFPKINGVFEKITNIEKLNELKSLVYFSCKAKTGQYVGKSAQGHKMCAVVILHNADKAQFDKDLEFVNRHVYVKTNS